MRKIEAVLVEPVGCLAEFQPEPFNEIAARLFGRKKKPSKSASRSYWHLLNLIESADRPLSDAERNGAEAIELEAAGRAQLYEDVIPALSEVRSMGVKLAIASSLSGAAVAQFLRKNSLGGFFEAVLSRDGAGGIKSEPLQSAVQAADVRPEHAMYLTDTAEGIKAAKSAGIHAVLMMNDPDEARRLAMHEPAGGIVSLHELPDFLRIVGAQNAGA
jgi:beta-phosphoglucomutase-like phosphatase (HAD superfamily)